MVHEESFITILFKLINLGVLLGFIGYMVRTRLLTNIKQSIMEQSRVDALVFHEHLQAEARQKQLQRDLEQQRAECARIKKHLVIWSEREQQRQKIIASERELRRSMLEQKVMVQSDYVTAATVRSQVAVQSLKNAEQVLRQHFSDAVKGQAHLSKVMVQLHKGVQ